MAIKPPKDDDKALWHTLREGVEPLRKKDKISSPPPKIQRRKTLHKKEDHEGEIFETRRLVRERSDGKREKIRPGSQKMALGGQIDLHGLTLEEAYTRLCRFLEHMQTKDIRWVLVITGKSGPLFEEVPKWLGAMPSYVSSVTIAHRHHGGYGSLYVGLKPPQS